MEDYPKDENGRTIYPRCRTCRKVLEDCGCKPEACYVVYGAAAQALEQEVRSSKHHPRQGYIVALFIGTRDPLLYLGDDQILIAITENYRLDGSGPYYHYSPWCITSPTVMCTKLIGSVDPFDPETATEPPRFVAGQFKQYTWRRLR